MKNKWVEFLFMGLFLAIISRPEVVQAVDAEAMIKVGIIQLMDHGKNFQDRPAIAVGANVTGGEKLSGFLPLSFGKNWINRIILRTWGPGSLQFLVTSSSSAYINLGPTSGLTPATGTAP